MGSKYQTVIRLAIHSSMIKAVKANAVFLWSGFFCGCVLIWQACICAPVGGEDAHVASGIAILRTGDSGYYRVNPPLHKLISGAAIEAVCDSKLSIGYIASDQRSGVRREFGLGEQHITENLSTYKTIFIVGRLVRIPLVLLCGFFLFDILRRYSVQAANLAACLWFFSPLVLGHGWAVTPDVLSGTAAMFLLSSTIHWICSRSWIDYILVGLAWGIAIGTKFTFCPVFVLWPLGLCLTLAVRRQLEIKSFLKLVAAHIGHGFIALIVVWGVYQGSDIGVSLKDHKFQSNRLSWIGAPDAETSPLGKMLGNFPSPFPKQFLVGIDEQQRDLEHGFSTYIAGVWFPDGIWWYYFPGYLLKENLAGLICLLIVTGTRK